MPVNDKKRAYGARLGDYINEYKQAFIVGCDNVGSRQMQQIRVALRGSAIVVMGKNVSEEVERKRNSGNGMRIEGGGGGYWCWQSNAFEQQLRVQKCGAEK